MTNCLAGINFDKSNPGFAHTVIRPYFVKDLDWGKGVLMRVNGLVLSAWHREKNGVVLTVTVPSNTDKLYTVRGGAHRFSFKD